jgi:hypothetical protein
MATAEATACYVISISSFKIALKSSQRLNGKFAFHDGDFAVWITINGLNGTYAFVELVHQPIGTLSQERRPISMSMRR